MKPIFSWALPVYGPFIKKSWNTCENSLKSSMITKTNSDKITVTVLVAAAAAAVILTFVRVGYPHKVT